MESYQFHAIQFSRIKRTFFFFKIYFFVLERGGGRALTGGAEGGEQESQTESTLTIERDAGLDLKTVDHKSMNQEDF